MERLRYVIGDKLGQFKDHLAHFVDIICKMTNQAAFLTYKKDVLLIFSRIISEQLFRYIKAELFSDLLLSLQYEVRNFTNDTDLQLQLMDLFSIFYRELAIIN